MYEILSVLAVFGLIYSIVAGRVERAWISGPILFLGFGVLIGPAGLGMIADESNPELLKTLAELTLAIVLFTDASGANLGVLRKTKGLPIRLLAIGLPLTILLGFGSGKLLLGSLTLVEVALVATMLAPTDAALGKAVVTNSAVPGPIREGLNVESGLNDGICVPIILLLITLAGEGGDASLSDATTLFAEVVGIGAAVGIAITFLAVALLRLAKSRDWLSETWTKVTVIAVAFSCFGVAQSFGGSGFIASFAGGMLFGALLKPHHEPLLDAAEGIGDSFSLLTWVLFGALTVGVMQSVTVPVVLYALLSLTVIRMLPVFLVVAGLGLNTESKLFVGWFGPRGLASIVFVVMAGSEVSLPHIETITAVVGCTVIGSIVLHGVTANPWAKAFASRSPAEDADGG